MIISNETIVGDMVAIDYRTAAVFQQNGIDFCCNGNHSLGEVCSKRAIDVESVIKQLEDVLSQEKSGALDYNSWPLDLLADYIEKKHHKYVENQSREILPYLQKIVSVHGSRHPELMEVEKLFKETVGEMSKHMKKEELLLFPFIKKMVKAESDKVSIGDTNGKAKTSIKAMMEDHNNEGERFRKIAELTNNYQTPADGCNTYKVTLGMLKEFEDDLFLHIHLENNILFPKSVILEESFVNS